MLNKVLIRVDGSAQIGLGHVVRCMALAQILQYEFQIHFVSREIPKSMVGDIIVAGFEFTKIENEEGFFNLLTGKEIVVLDNYFFETTYQKRIKEKSGCKLVCIDDLHDRVFYADLIINHSPGIVSKDYCAQEYTKYALGLEFALLRPAFLEAAKSSRIVEKVERVLICFGGSDFKNLTKSVLEAIHRNKSFKRITVIVGQAYAYRESLEDLINENQNIRVLSSLDESEMLFEIRAADLAIIPTSGIFFEVLAGGCIPLICYYAENQKRLFNYFKKNTVISTFNAIEFNKQDFNKLISKIVDTESVRTVIPLMNKIRDSSINNLNNFKTLVNE